MQKCSIFRILTTCTNKVWNEMKAKAKHTSKISQVPDYAHVYSDFTYDVISNNVAILTSLD